MDETKIEQVEATPEVEVAEAPVAEAPAAEVEAEVADNAAPEAEVVEEPAAEAPAEVVAEGCDCEDDKAKSEKVKKEPEDDQDEKKVAVKEVKAGEKVDEALMDILLDKASARVGAIVEEALASKIDESLDEDGQAAAKGEIMEAGKALLKDVMDVLEEVVAGTTLELNGHQVTVNKFTDVGGKVGMTAAAGINPPEKHENDEHEKKVHIEQYNAKESADEIDYKAKYAESEACMDDLVKMVETTSANYTKVVEDYNKVVKELQAYKIAEAHGLTVDDAADLLADYPYEAVVEELERQEKEEVPVVNENCEEKAEEAEVAPAEEKDDKDKEKKEEEKEKEPEEAIKESMDNVDGVVISTGVVGKKVQVFSAFSTPVFEGKRTNVFSAFSD